MKNTDPQTIVEAEVIYGAMKREQMWKALFVGMAVACIICIASVSAVLIYLRPPAPHIVPFDPTTGMAVPNAQIEAVSLDERTAVIQSLVYQYVVDRETYNQLDNDIRINRALARTTGAARTDLVSFWDSGSENYLPDRYGPRTEVDVVVTGITLLENDRVQVRMRKRLANQDGANVGNFTAVIHFEFDADEQSTLEAVWQNPLGFTIDEYELYQDRREQ